MTNRMTQSSRSLRTRAAGLFALALIAGGFFEVALCSTLVVPGATAAAAPQHIAAEPLYRLRFAVSAAYFRASAYADQTIGAIEAAPAALVADARKLGAVAVEHMQKLLTLEVQAQGADITVAFFGLKWVLSGS